MKINTNSKEFQQVIQEEANRFKKKMMLESEKESISKKLNEMKIEEQVLDLQESLGLNEGLGTWFMNLLAKMDASGKRQDFMESMPMKIKMWVAKRAAVQPSDEDVMAVMAAADKDQWEGDLGIDPTSKKIVYMSAGSQKAGARTSTF